MSQNQYFLPNTLLFEPEQCKTMFGAWAYSWCTAIFSKRWGRAFFCYFCWLCIYFSRVCQVIYMVYQLSPMVYQLSSMVYQLNCMVSSSAPWYTSSCPPPPSPPDACRSRPIQKIYYLFCKLAHITENLQNSSTGTSNLDN